MKADEILKLIENVDVNDSDALDGIDARVICYLNGYTFNRLHPSYPEKYRFWIKGEDGSESKDFVGYTRSRDALKSTRPDGWIFQVSPCYKEWQGFALSNDDKNMLSTTILPTEELAELHAIIQTIEWSRNND